MAPIRGRARSSRRRVFKSDSRRKRMAPVGWRALATIALHKLQDHTSFHGDVVSKFVTESPDQLHIL
uniref:Uncharacterized protein n=1 Tax=Setaria viridis TaxID=4556 RepID=A0A4U6W584_SETVI|nr:hypothetical protein SEVIR_2G401601v2 [Setaria viridis]